MNFNGVELWQVIAGIGIFLLGMSMLEDALKQLAGRSFKVFLKKHVSKKLNAIGSGAVVTAVLQSSSVVNLLVLAFVGSGMLTMQNALAVIMGANLGTTISTWLVATVGFGVNIEDFAFPIVGIAGIALMALKKTGRPYQWSRFFLGFSLLFVGLDFMKTGIISAVNTVDLSALAHYPLVVFIITGLVITSLIQSSSATIAIALSALYAGAINLYQAMGIVLGSEIGTTLKLLIAATGDAPVKKRVALGNFLFNVIGVAIILLFLQPIYRLVVAVGIKDQLISLAFFQSFMNIVSVVIFFPFLGVFGKFLERRFLNNSHTTQYLHQVNTTDTELGIDALEKETAYFLQCILQFSREILHIPPHDQYDKVLNAAFLKKEILEKYESIKHLHGDIYAYYLALNKNPNSKENTMQLDKLISAVRNGMYAAKSIKDAMYDIETLRNSSNEVKYGHYKDLKKLAATFYTRLADVANSGSETHFGELVNLYTFVQQQYDEAIKEMYTSAAIQSLSEIEVSTILNLNREMFSSMKALLFLAKGYLLTEKNAAYFDDLPGFIR